MFKYWNNIVVLLFKVTEINLIKEYTFLFKYISVNLN